jgi:glucan phosphoethanolaminetransferase (alkaline phosphatase superfamily)
VERILAGLWIFGDAPPRRTIPVSNRSLFMNIPRIKSALRSRSFDPVIWMTLGLAGMVTLLLNLPYYLQFKSHSGWAFALALVGSFVATFTFFLLLTAHRVVLYFLVPPVILACGAAIYFIHELGVYINENTLGLVFETNLGEASDLMSLELYGCLGAAALVSFLYVRAVVRRLGQSRTARRLLWAGGLFILHLLCALQTKKIEAYDPPLGFVSNAYVYLREKGRVSVLLKSREDISLTAKLSRIAEDEDLTLIVVVGETVRPDHLHINGYPRPTTPELERWGAVSFPDVLACAANTRFAVPCMLTRGTREDLRRPYHESSLISVFRRLNFDTWWVSMQGKFLEAIVPNEYTVAATAAIAEEAEHVVYLNPTGDVSRVRHFDTELLPVVDEALTTMNGRQLIVLHTIGAHFHYSSRYPESHAHYKPACKDKRPKACRPDELNNAYDNAMHFLDDFMGQLIKRVETRNALVLYVSDHGESLGEGGKFLHHLGSEEPEQNRVAMLAWASAQFREKHAESWKALSENASKKLSHDHLFHSVLDCAGVQTPVLDRSLSICAQARERTYDLPPNRISISFK